MSADRATDARHNPYKRDPSVMAPERRKLMPLLERLDEQAKLTARPSGCMPVFDALLLDELLTRLRRIADNKVAFVSPSDELAALRTLSAEQLWEINRQMLLHLDDMTSSLKQQVGAEDVPLLERAVGLTCAPDMGRGGPRAARTARWWRAWDGRGTESGKGAGRKKTASFPKGERRHLPYTGGRAVCTYYVRKPEGGTESGESARQPVRSSTVTSSLQAPRPPRDLANRCASR